MNKRELRNYLDTFCKNLFDSFEGELKTLVQNNCFLAGGCFKSLLLNEKVNDYDFYFRDQESAKRFYLLIQQGLKTTATPFTNMKRLVLKDLAFKTHNAITFTFDYHKVQFVTKFTGKPSDVVNKFDFLHCQNYYDPLTGLLENRGFDSIAARKLKFNPDCSHPINSLKRMVKLVNQGWSIGDEELMKITLTINSLVFKNGIDFANQAAGMYGALSITDEELVKFSNKKFENKVNKFVLED